jgi:hypothetical protein
LISPGSSCAFAGGRFFIFYFLHHDKYGLYYLPVQAEKIRYFSRKRVFPEKMQKSPFFRCFSG